MGFGEKLKELRGVAGISQVALADKSGVPVGTIRDYEQAKRTPLLSTAVKLARGLGESVAVFADCVDATPKVKPAKRKGK